MDEWADDLCIILGLRLRSRGRWPVHVCCSPRTALIAALASSHSYLVADDVDGGTDASDGTYASAREGSTGPATVLGRLRRLLGLLFAMGFSCLIMAGCSSDALAASEAQRDFRDMIQGVIDDAQAGGAGEEQLAVLRNAQTEGAMSLEDARAVTRAAVQCVKDAGSDAFYQERTTETGLVLPEYNSLANTPEQMAIADACSTQVEFWVRMAYVMQPTSIAQKDAYLDQQVPLVIACLEREGYNVDPGLSTRDVLRQAVQVNTETAGAVDCLAEAGIEGF